MTCPAGYNFTPFKGGPLAPVTEHLKPGQRFLFWDYDITWSHNHMRSSELEPYRMMGDPLADDALEALDVKKGQDAFEALMTYTSRPIEEQPSEAPPGGFNAPKISKVLTSTGYLAGNKTKYRVLETGQFVVDVMHSPGYLVPETGLAWKSIIQVRLLHAQVRQKLSRLSRAHSKYYSIEEYGVPINQEDLAGTLYSFSVAMWKVMQERMGVNMTPEECDDYLHVWRYIGYMMGVDPDFDPANSVERAEAILESIVMHVIDPTQSGGQLCAGLLQSMHGTSSSPLRLDPFKLHMAMAESLLGPQVWSLMGHSPTPSFYRLLVNLVFTFLYVDLWSVSKMQWWFRLRSWIFLHFQYHIFRSELGDKHSNFSLAKEPKVRDNDLEDVSLAHETPNKSRSSSYTWIATWITRTMLMTVSIAIIAAAVRM
ncbi:hypothetical protein BGW42_005254 [Actinomortierella wolfii]|nr:hypothetical protein BGW42_005254 [Actinomortierella wolfii]